VRQNEPSSALGTSSLRPDAARSRPGVQGEEMSTASIKSGIIGFPQGTSQLAQENDHPAQQTLGGSQILGGGSTAGSRGASGIDNPIDDGKGPFGTTNTSELGDSSGYTGTDRAFPLAGGVTQNRSTEKNITREREPGTKEKEVGVHDGQGKEALAGAAAAATSSYSPPHSETERNVGSGSQNYHPDALAAATAAAANTHSVSAHDQEGERHIAFRGSPEANSSQYTRPAPISNVSDSREPRLHIPGEFPSPTPVGQSSAPSYFQSKETPTTSSGDQHELRHTGTLDHPQTRSADEPERSEHHYGRDAAIAGGLGAAGAGAYAAGRHGQDEPAQTGDNIFPTEASPYSSKQVDPRVDNRPAPSYDQQKFDPTTSTKHQGRDAVLTGGAPTTTTQAHPTSESTTQHAAQPTEEKSKHHYGRDAALVGTGAGAATTAGLYASQRANEPDSGPAKSTIGPHQTDIANILDPKVQPDPALQKHHHAAPTVDDPAPSTVGPHKSDAANILDPRVHPDPQKQKAHPKDEHHYGRDAAVAGGTGAAGYGAYDAAKSYGEHPATQPTASLNDQRYDPSAPGAHNPSLGSSQRTQDHDQKPEHHYGRDAAVVGGLGAAGAGTYAVTRDNTSTQRASTAGQYNNPLPPTHQLAVAQQHYDSTPVAQQQYPPQANQKPEDSQHHYGRDAAVVGGLGAAGAGAYAATRRDDRTQQPAAQQHTPYQPTQQSTVGGQQYPSGQTTQYPQTTPATQQPQHHYGRDAAVVGGLGAAGAGTYATTRGNDHTQQPGMSQQQYPAQASSQPPLSSTNQHQQQQRYDPAQDPNTQHQKRDAAVLGAAGAAAGAGGAYAYSQHDAEKERKAAEKAQEHQLKEQQKEFEKKQKEQEKAHKKAEEKAAHDKQKELDHQHAKDQKHHDKLVAAEEHKRQKEMEKEHHDKLVAAEEHKRQKEMEKEQHEREKAHPDEEGEEKKKHKLFGFLHRDKDKRRSIDETDRRASGDSPRRSKEYAGAGAAAGVGGAAAYEGLHESDSDRKSRNKLHKEPPPGHPAREALEHQQHQEHQRSPITGKREHIGTDGPIGDKDRISGGNGDR
jgi:hypothetical protein